MRLANRSPAAIANELGDRLKQARLNNNLTQVEVAELAGVTRKTVLNAEKGKVQIEAFIAIMSALNLTEQLDRFLPKQDISPIQLSKLLRKTRQRASGRRKTKNREASEW
ncbi:MAG: helix-turn-helix transcriptional regulator [Proteobacteria bacterium]|nr:helix-turn-helix transcriptional regulator [Pseudomonadota bacterium]MCH8173858.1 helix-turn-helix transcriptional regulator [Pseudomonadota bacterium]